MGSRWFGAATAWGQATFQGGKYVMILLEILWAEPMKGYLGWCFRLIPKKVAIRPAYKTEHEAARRGVEGPGTTTAGCGSRLAMPRVLTPVLLLSLIRVFRTF
jgi:hypothetical protein